MPSSVDDTQSLSGSLSAANAPLSEATNSAHESVVFLQEVIGSELGRVWPLPVGQAVLGRSREADICLDSSHLSRRHAVIQLLPDGRMWLADLRSANGTSHNGRRLVGEPVELRPGDRIGLGGSCVLAVLRAGRLEFQTQAQLYQAATHDPLTGLLNRRAVTERLEREFHAAQQLSRPLSVLLIDVDNFKSINDSFGHIPAGDAVLAAVAAELGSDLRTTDAVGRVGGEEFLILLPNAEPTMARRIAEELCQRIPARPIATEDAAGRALQLSVTVSVGVATHSPAQPSASATALLAQADRWLLAAKRSGRNRVVGTWNLPTPLPEPSSRSRLGEVDTKYETLGPGGRAPLLGELLVWLGFVTAEQVRAARKLQSQVPNAPSLGEILVAQGACTADQIRRALDQQRQQTPTPPST